MWIDERDIGEVVAQLLGRRTGKSDGTGEGELERAELCLGIELPDALRRLYALCGRVDMLVSSFEQIAPPGQLAIEDGKLVFAEENQGVCDWGVDLPDGMVYQRRDGQWVPEGARLAPFLNLLLYANCAQGGYSCCGVMDARSCPPLGDGWSRVVEHNGLLIYARESNLVWRLGGDCYLSSRTEEDFLRYAETYGFEEL